MKPFIVIPLILLASVQPLLAADESMEMITVTGTYLPQTTSAGRIPKITITSEEIQALAPNSFADVLRGQPGVDIMEQGGVGGLTFLSLRGGDPNFVVILVDGVKVNDPTNSRGGAFDLGTLDPAIIEKVDIFFGGFSTIYGSDALAGVVSIETKSVADDKLGTVSVKTGSHGMSGGAAHVGLMLADVAELSVAGSYQDGDDSSFGHAFHRKELKTALTSASHTDIRWHIGVFYADGHAQSFPEDSGGDRLAVIRSPETRNFTQTNLAARFQRKIWDSVQLDLNSAWSKREEDISSPGIAPGVLDPVPAIISQTSNDRLDLSATASFRISAQLSGALGVAVADENGAMDSLIDFGFPVPATYTLQRQNKSIIAEAGLDPVDGLNITAGIRHDKAEQLTVTTRRLISRYQADPTTTISAQYSEGFKLPSFFALGHPFVGNPKLNPEQSKNIELSLENSFLNNEVVTRTSLYQNTFTDLVDFDPIAFTNINRTKVRAQGAEIYLALTPSQQLSLSGQISYNKIDTFEAGTVLRRRPQWKGSLLINYKPVDSLSLTIRASANDDYFDSSIPTGMVVMNSFSRLDMTAAWQMGTDLNLSFSAINVLDSNHEEAIGFNNRGPSLTARLTKTF